MSASSLVSISAFNPYDSAVCVLEVMGMVNPVGFPTFPMEADVSPCNALV